MKLLADAGEFFEEHLWEAETAGPGRDALAKRCLNGKTIRAFGVGYAPVVDADGRLLGVVSETDLILQEVEGEDLEQPHAIPFIGDPIVWGGTHDFEKQFRRSFGATAADLMTPKPVTIGPDETVHKAARILAREDVARLPVVPSGVRA